MPRTVLVSNLYPKVDVTDLCKEFGKYGRILSAKIECGRYLTPIGKGAICFLESSSADIAVKEMNGKKKLGNPIRVVVEKSEKRKNQPDPPRIDESKVFVNNLDPSWDECDLLKIFKEFGEIDEVKISDTDGKSNGYGFVKFLQPSSAKKAIERINNNSINQRNLIIETFIPWELREKARQNLDFAKERDVEFNNLHVKNLERDVTEEELNKLFQTFGSILSVKVARDESGNSKGFGFVCFKKEKDAAKAREQMDHFSYKAKILEVNFNQKKSAREKYLRAIKSDPKIRKFKGGKESAW